MRFLILAFALFSPNLKIAAETLCDIEVPADPGPPPPGDTLTSSDDSGTYSAGRITINAGTTITMDGDLKIVANEDVKIGGNILFPKNGSSKYNLTIVSWNGSVIIENTATIGGGNRVKATNGRPGKIGGDGGDIVIIAKSLIHVNGAVTGNTGGVGGDSSHSNPWFVNANSQAGDGGNGGNILFCTMEYVSIDKVVTAGAGGDGGAATATDDKGDPSTSKSGNGGIGGNVTFKYRGSPPGNLTIAINSSVIGGVGGAGGISKSTGTTHSNAGIAAVATANGGNGNSGGTVLFENINPSSDITLTKGGDGGKGGDANAVGGIGRSRPIGGGGLVTAGANADATAGNGGPAGKMPTLAGGGDGKPGSDGAGGVAMAKAGAGGNGAVSVQGASSGVAKAQGGADGAGSNRPALDSKGPIPNQGQNGGPGPTAKSPP